MRQKYKYGACGVIGVRGEKAPMRRSVTIIEENHKHIQRARGMLLLGGATGGLDMDFTTALNLFLRMGLKKFFKDSLDDDDIEYLATNDKAKMEITQDELDEIKKKMSKFAEDMRLDEYRRERDQREKAEAESVAK
ncbi:MAG TPA: hypothetical protein VI037_04980 [Nitrososphaera sp.]